MFGHGSPNFQQSHRRDQVCIAWQFWRQRYLLRFADVFLVFVLLAFCPAAMSPVALSQEVKDRNREIHNESLRDVQLRFAWGGGAAQRWTGGIEITGGKFHRHRPLAITSDAPSTVTAIQDGNHAKLKINHRATTSYGGVDVSVSFNPNTTIRVTLQGSAGIEFQKQWKVKELVAGVNATVDGQQNRISVSRVPGDALRIKSVREHLVFEPGESWELGVALNRYAESSQSCELLFRWGGENALAKQIRCSIDETGTSAWNEFSLKVPRDEGVHDLSVEIETAMRTPFGQFRKSRKVLRTLQLVVVDSARSAVIQKEWTVSKSYGPKELKGDIRSTWPLSRISGIQTPVHHGDIEVLPNSDLNSELSLKVGLDAWLAVPVERTDGAGDSGPVRIQIQYDAQPGTKLGVNFLTAGQTVLHGMDSGICVPETMARNGESVEWLVHEFVVWPGDREGHVLISNVGETAARLGSIKISSGPRRIGTEQKVGFPANRRKRMAMLESPDFGGLFQSRRKLDPATGQILDDWQTFYDSVDRLTQHLKANHYDGAFVTILSDGSAVFPTGGIAPGPRYDSGVFSSAASDPMQKDVVELMLRMFDREGLVFVPVLSLNSTLPELERARSENGPSFELTDSAGKAVPFGKRRLPIYDPLDLKVQNECLRLVEHVARRYESHDSFGGLALTIRPNCYSLLPGTKYGYHPETIGQFLNDHQITPDQFNRDALLADAGDGATRDAWLTWRERRIAAWYRKIAATISSSSQRNLFLMPIDIFQNSELESALSPSLHRSSNLANAMQQMGLHLDDETKAEGVVMLSSNRVEPGGLLRDQRVKINLEASSIADRFHQATSDGSLFAHQGTWRPMQVGDFVAGLDSQTRHQMLSTGGSEARRNYIRSIRRYDSPLIVDSGKSLPQGNRAELESVFEVFRRLPAVRFRDIGDNRIGPVCMRQHFDGNQHWFYAVNDSPWPVEVVAELSDRAPQALQASATKRKRVAPMTTLDGETVNFENSTDGVKIRVFLEPWSIFAGTSTVPSGVSPFSIDRFEVKLPDQLESRLRKRIYQLKSKLTKAKTGVPIEQLKNGSFENFADPNQSGWEFGNHDQGNFSLDSSNVQDGKTSLTMRTSGKPVWIRSNVLALPKTGRLSVSVWLKTNTPDRQPPLRISAEGISDGSNVYRFGKVGSSEDASGSQAIETEWKRFAVHFDDLPSDLTNLKIGFDLMGEGEVSIDNVEVYDRWFDESDSVAITQLLASAGSQLQNPLLIDDSRRVLENYWIQFLDHHFSSNPAETVSGTTSMSRPFELPIPQIQIPKFEPLPTSPKKAKRIPFLQRLQRR